MYVLVTYYSKTGNTAALAEGAALGAALVDGVDARLKKVEDLTREDFAECSGLIVGAPTYFGGPAWQVKKLLDEMISLRRRMEGKPGAALASSASPQGGRETTLMGILQAMLIYGMIVVGDPLDTGGHYGAAATGAPDGSDIVRARKLGRRVAELAKRLDS